MAQQIITLATEETSQEILTRVKALEISTSALVDTTDKLWGGYKYPLLLNSGLLVAGQNATLRITGRALVHLVRTVSGNNFYYTIDGINLGTTRYFLSSHGGAPEVFECFKSATLYLVSDLPNGSGARNSILAFIRFADENGTATMTIT